MTNGQIKLFSILNNIYYREMFKSLLHRLIKKVYSGVNCSSKKMITLYNCYKTDWRFVSDTPKFFKAIKQQNWKQEIKKLDYGMQI